MAGFPQAIIGVKIDAGVGSTRLCEVPCASGFVRPSLHKRRSHLERIEPSCPGFSSLGPGGRRNGISGVFAAVFAGRNARPSGSNPHPRGGAAELRNPPRLAAERLASLALRGARRGTETGFFSPYFIWRAASRPVWKNVTALHVAQAVAIVLTRQIRHADRRRVLIYFSACSRRGKARGNPPGRTQDYGCLLG